MVERISEGLIDEKFFIWMDYTFGYDIGHYTLTETWHTKNIPCKYSWKTRTICNGYYDMTPYDLKNCNAYTIVKDEDCLYLQLWSEQWPKDTCLVPEVEYRIEKSVLVAELENLP